LRERVRERGLLDAIWFRGRGGFGKIS